MANDLTPLYRQIHLARERIARMPVGFIDAANIDASASVAAQGEEVQVSLSQDAENSDIVAGLAAAEGDDSTFTSITVAVTKFRKNTFKLTHEESRRLWNGGTTANFFSDKITRGVKILAEEIENDLAGLAYRGCRAHGTVGEKLFDTAGDFTDLSYAREILQVNGADTNGFYAVIDTKAGAEMRGRQSAATTMIDPRMQRSAIIPQTMGGFILESAFVNTHDSSNAAGKLVNSADLKVGDQAIPVDGSATDLVPGDVFTIAGDTNQYIVASYANNTITINRPGLRVAPADNAAITVLADHMQNMVVSPDGLVLLSRLPGLDGEQDQADIVIQFTDPLTGINFELRRYPQYRQQTWEIATAWGVGAYNPEGISVLLQ